MANAPNARRYQTGSTKAGTSTAGGGWRHEHGDGHRAAGPRAAQVGGPKWGAIGKLIALLAFVALAVKFPIATLTICAIALVVKLS